MRLLMHALRWFRAQRETRSLKRQLRDVQDVRPHRHWSARMLDRARRWRVI